MKTHILERTQRIERSVDVVFSLFADAANLEALTPPFLHFSILTRLPVAMAVDTRIDYRLWLFGVPMNWRTRITDWVPEVRFVDQQEAGPYAFWRHTHSFAAEGGGTVVHDRVEYALPLGPLGTLARRLFVARVLDRIFDHRRDAILSLLERPLPLRVA